MVKAETQETVIARPTSDYLLDNMWSDPACEHELSTLDADREKFADYISKNSPHNIISTHDYLFYLGNKIDENTHNNQQTPHKALFQLIGAKLGITEPTTRVVPTKDLATAFTYGLHLLANHEIIWIGTGAIDDHSDPSGRQNIDPPLYKNIRTREDLLDALRCANAFEHSNSGSYLKIFPQDGEHPAIGSMVFSNNKKEGKWIHLKIRKGEYTTSERKAGDDKPISISMDMSKPFVKIYTNQSTQETNAWLQIIINSQELFQKLDNADLKGSDYINPEFLIFLNDPSRKIPFFTDCIWGSKIKSMKGNPCPKTDALLSKLLLSINQEKVVFVPEKYNDALTQSRDYQLAVLNTLKSARSPNPDIQAAQFILKTQECFHSLRLPFEIPKIAQPILDSLWNISRGYPLNNTINIIEHYQNQLLITERPDPNIDFNQTRAKLDRYIRRRIPYWLYKFLNQKYLEFKVMLTLPSDKEFHKILQLYLSKKLKRK